MLGYKLLTPGPLTTTESVKQEMLVDHCTWDTDYMQITQDIRSGLLELAHCNPEIYTTVLMQGSGTFGVESTIISSVGKEDKILICSNGAYGLRMCQIAESASVPYMHYREAFDTIIDAKKVAEILENNPDITHVAMVHSETTTGILNDIASVAKVAKENDKVFIVDAMSSFGGVEIDVEALDIDFLVSSANKCIQGVPGFSFIIAKTKEIEKCKGKSCSLSLDLYDQWLHMNPSGKWRFTSPTHVVLAFAKAMEELQKEGGISKREMRYRKNNALLIAGMKALGFQSYVKSAYQSPIITTFYYPENKKIAFMNFYTYIKENGYAIYPGKLTEAETFRVGNIGEIYPEDMEKLCNMIGQYMDTEYLYNV
ncbi:2-aminoethylphosphonate--pyruvate transaminase [Chakrabartyella piscis]|uniref:2-aminoethylphosphonate--pyruvate transaminase n=1 Tax=Chakrabartyella piscis TaxID=2918914 RepID=UPI00295886E9|nr:2-aminoethylphosphonate--pyruvate transaminase [Chakrabartyella piscis]